MKENRWLLILMVLGWTFPAAAAVNKGRTAALPAPSIPAGTSVKNPCSSLGRIYGLPPADLRSLCKKGLSPREVGLALSIYRRSGAPPIETIDLRRRGAAWMEIARRNGLDLDDLRGEAAFVERHLEKPSDASLFPPDDHRGNLTLMPTTTGGDRLD